MDLDSPFAKYCLVSTLIHTGLQLPDGSTGVTNKDHASRQKLLAYMEGMEEIIVRSKAILSEAHAHNMADIKSLYNNVIYRLVGDLNYKFIKSSDHILGPSYTNKIFLENLINNMDGSEKEKVIELKEFIFSTEPTMNDLFHPLNGCCFSRKDYITSFTTIDDTVFSNLQCEWPTTVCTITTLLSLAENLIEDKKKIKEYENGERNEESGNLRVRNNQC